MERHSEPIGVAPAASRRDESGLMTLEWLLIFAAVISLGAVSVLIVQQVLDGAIDLPPDREVLLVEADIAAARISSDLRKAGASTDEAPFQQRCDDIVRQFSDVVDHTTWFRGIPAGMDDPITPEFDPSPAQPAKCTVTARA